MKDPFSSLKLFSPLLEDRAGEPPSAAQERARAEFPQKVAESNITLRNPDEPIRQSGRHVILGFATNSKAQLWSLDLLNAIVKSHPKIDVIEVFDVVQCKSNEDFEEMIPGIGVVPKTPVIGIYSDGDLIDRAFGDWKVSLKMNWVLRSSNAVLTKTHRAVTEWLVLLCFPLFLWAIWLNWPRILIDHSRLEPWQVAGVWAGDATALFWFLRFVYRRYGLAKPWEEVRTTPANARRIFWLTFGSLFLGMAIDLGMNAYILHEEQEATHRAVTTQGILLTSERGPEDGGGVVYRITCQFADQNGQQYRVTLPLMDRKTIGFGEHVSEATAEAIRQRKINTSLAISYDPHWPYRAWLSEAGNEFEPWAGNWGGYVFLDMIVLLCQLQLTLFYVLFVSWYYHAVLPRGTLAWWHEPFSVAPFCFQAVFLALLSTPIWLVTGWR